MLFCLSTQYCILIILAERQQAACMRWQTEEKSGRYCCSKSTNLKHQRNVRQGHLASIVTRSIRRMFAQQHLADILAGNHCRTLGDKRRGDLQQVIFSSNGQIFRRKQQKICFVYYSKCRTQRPHSTVTTDATVNSLNKLRSFLACDLPFYCQNSQYRIIYGGIATLNLMRN